MDRKLAAILAADVVGYSSMMERDEAGTHQRLRSLRSELFDPTIARHHGIVFKLMGDGMLAEFSSVVEAVGCAAALQRALAERNSASPREHRVEIRIGINLGEVIVEEGDRFGEGVNIAARLEKLAEPGSIWVSAKVAREVEKKLPFDFRPMGLQRVRNIAEPVEAYRVETGGMLRHGPVRRPVRRLPFVAVALALLLAAVAGFAWWVFPSPSGRDERAGVPTIAVLPFRNMNGDPALQYFSDGLTDNLISMLGRVPELKVLSRGSTLAYRDKPADTRRIGEELHADYVIEGGVWKEADRVRVTAQLIESRTGENVWADRFDRTGTDPLAVQDQAVERIVATLGGQRGKMYDNEYRKVWAKDSTELEEYDFFLRSNFFFQQYTPESLAEATRIILDGLAKFPDSSLLSCGLAWDHVLAVNLGFDRRPPEEHWRAAAELEAKVLSRPNVGPDARKSCLWSSVYVSAHEGRFDLSLRRAEELIALSPGDALLVGDMSQPARFEGNTEEALKRADFGLRNDPGFADYYLMLKANALTDVGRYAESAALLANATDFQITIPLLRAINGIHLGRIDEARAQVAKALELQPWYTAERWRDMTFHVDRAVIDRQVADLIAAGLPAG